MYTIFFFICIPERCSLSATMYICICMNFYFFIYFLFFHMHIRAVLSLSYHVHAYFYEFFLFLFRFSFYFSYAYQGSALSQLPTMFICICMNFFFFFACIQQKKRRARFFFEKNVLSFSRAFITLALFDVCDFFFPVLICIKIHTNAQGICMYFFFFWVSIPGRCSHSAAPSSRCLFLSKRIFFLKKNPFSDAYMHTRAVLSLSIAFITLPAIYIYI